MQFLHYEKWESYPYLRNTINPPEPSFRFDDVQMQIGRSPSKSRLSSFEAISYILFVKTEPSLGESNIPLRGLNLLAPTFVEGKKLVLVF